MECDTIARGTWYGNTKNSPGSSKRDNGGPKFQEEDVQVHDLIFLDDMESSRMYQNCNLGPSVATPKFPDNTPKFVTPW